MEDQRINRESEVYDRTVDCALVRRCLGEQEDLSGRIHCWCADDDWVTYLLLENHHQVPIMFHHNHFFMHGLSGSRVLQLISFAKLVPLAYLHCTVWPQELCGWVTVIGILPASETDCEISERLQQWHPIRPSITMLAVIVRQWSIAELDLTGQRLYPFISLSWPTHDCVVAADLPLKIN